MEQFKRYIFQSLLQVQLPRPLELLRRRPRLRKRVWHALHKNWQRQHAQHWRTRCKVMRCCQRWRLWPHACAGTCMSPCRCHPVRLRWRIPVPALLHQSSGTFSWIILLEASVALPRRGAPPPTRRLQPLLGTRRGARSPPAVLGLPTAAAASSGPAHAHEQCVLCLAAIKHSCML